MCASFLFDGISKTKDAYFGQSKLVWSLIETGWRMIGVPNRSLIGLVQVKIHFEAFNVRYLWPLVQPQYQPFGSRLILHNPLGLS